MSKKALGRGLAALIPDSRLEELEQESYYIPVHQISSYAGQPRKFFHDKNLEELAQSIKNHGVIQPLIVTRTPEGYQLIAGERRLRAAKLAGLTEVPAIIAPIAEDKKLEVSLIENIQREDLNLIEEALAYQSMQDELGLTQEEIAQRVGKDRSTVANLLRLLKLPVQIKQYLAEGQISMGHARALLALGSTHKQLQVCQRIISHQMSVRETEKYIQRLERPARPKPSPDAFFQDLEERLKQALSTKVKITHTAPSRGKISIEFYSAEELEHIIQIIMRGKSHY